MPASRFRTSFSLAVAAFLSTVTVGTANARECKADSDCASGFECVLDNSASGWGGSTGSVGSAGSTGSTGTSGGSSGAGAATGTACAGDDCVGSSPMPTVPPPVQVDGGDVVGPSTTPVVTTGSCQVKSLICSTKADCPVNLDCVKETAMAGTPTCAPDTTCGTTVPPTLETGTCKAVCNVDADCPAPLTCKVQGGTCSGGAAVSSDGTVTTMPETCTGGAKICSYQAVTCSSDTECTDSNYQCAKVSESESCSGSAPANCPKSTGDAGTTCTTTPPEPPVCTSTVVNNCIPKEINCDAGQTCPTGWSCFDFSYFEDASIPGWSTPMPSKACLPDGLILVIKGQASGGSSATYSGSTPTKGGTDSVALGDGGTQGPVTTDGGVPPQAAPLAPSDGGTAATSHQVSGGGCAMGGSRRGSFELWLTLGLAGVVLRLVRRRK